MYNNYTTIGSFGNTETSAQNSPVSYCFVSGLDSGFNHILGGDNNLLGQKSLNCQIFSAEYCAQDWNGICEFASRDEERNGTVVDQTYNNCGTNAFSGLSMGEILVRNTAKEKYLQKMSGNCKRVYQPFDPTVGNSVLISSWEPTGNGCNNTGNCSASNVCIPIYGVNPEKIDSDPVMNKILNKPWIAMDILINIYNTAKNEGTLRSLVGTKLYNYFMSPQFQNIVNSPAVNTYFS
jgi:hypothetical protein